MLSTAELISEIAEELNDGCDDRSGILKKVNKAIVTMSGTDGIYLPDLLISGATIKTVVGAYSVLLPSNYQKHLLCVLEGGSPIRIHDSISSLTSAYDGLSADTGGISGVAIQGRKMFYQPVPEVATEVKISYYKKPDEVSDLPSSYPQGVSSSQSFDDAIVNYCLWKMYQKIEDAMEGPKGNTGYYKNEYFEALDNLRHFCARDVGPRYDPPASSSPKLFINF